MVTASLYVVGVCVNRIGTFKRRPELGGCLGGPRAAYARIFTAIDSEAASNAYGKRIVQSVKQLKTPHPS